MPLPLGLPRAYHMWKNVVRRAKDFLFKPINVKRTREEAQATDLPDGDDHIQLVDEEDTQSPVKRRKLGSPEEELLAEPETNDNDADGVAEEGVADGGVAEDATATQCKDNEPAAAEPAFKGTPAPVPFEGIAPADLTLDLEGVKKTEVSFEVSGTVDTKDLSTFDGLSESIAVTEKMEGTNGEVVVQRRRGRRRVKRNGVEIVKPVRRSRRLTPRKNAKATEKTPGACEVHA